VSTETQTLSFNQMVNAKPEQVYHAFTNSTALREWLCDVATTAPHPGGRLYLWWNDGYYSAGEYTGLKPNEQVAFKWHGRNDPQATAVRVWFSPQEEGTLVTLEHSGIGTGEQWAEIAKEIKNGWETALENLVSIMETGQDLRFVNRPMLGIGLSEFNAEIAEKMGVPVNEGIRVDNVIEGMGAQKSGLQSNDVITGLGDQPVIDWASLTSALQKHRAGDQIKVVFYRGADKNSVNMELSRRPLPEIPPTPSELAEAVRGRQAEVEAELDRLFEGVTEAAASHQPAPNEWSAKEILAHLIHSEYYWHHDIAQIVTSQEGHFDDFGGNLHALMEATVAVYPTLLELREAYRRANQLTSALIARLPEAFLARKASYWRLAYNALESPFHFHGHAEQMRAAIAAARESSS
jgi:uncharacterized protein YndB with AHSA1/START domain